MKNVIEIFYGKLIMDAKNVNFCKPINVCAKFPIFDSMTDSLLSLWLHFWIEFVHFHETKSNVNNDAFEDTSNSIVIEQGGLWMISISTHYDDYNYY